MITVALMAATTTEVSALSAIVESFAGYGVVGTVCIALGFVAHRGQRRDQQRSDDALERERARADRAEQANAELNKELRERMFPTLTEVARVLSDVVQQLRDLDRR